MIKVELARPEHVYEISPKIIFTENPLWKHMVRSALEVHDAITFTIHGEVLAIVGFQELYPRVGEFWAITSEACSLYPIAFHRKVFSLLELFAAQNKLKRVQMTVRADYPEGIRWAQALGFRYEGLMEAYGPEGADYVMMGRVR